MKFTVISFILACCLNFSHQAWAVGESYIVTELFTAQACPACPPAEKFMQELIHEHSSDMIGLTYHIKLWDKLGWKDSFAKKIFTKRHKEYAIAQKLTYLSTPQITVNGIDSISGNSKQKVTELIKQAIKNKRTHFTGAFKENADNISLYLKPNKQHRVFGDAEIWAVYCEKSASAEVPNKLGNKVTRTSTNIVRDMKKIGTWSNNAIEVSFQHPKDNLHAVILVQRPNYGRILAGIQYN